MPVVEHYAVQDKVFRVSGVPPPDVVFAATRKIIDPIVEREVLAHNQLLLDAVHNYDWATYERLTAPDVTAIEGTLQHVWRESCWLLPTPASQLCAEPFVLNA